jgi:secreted Zn-dependent insulinase-like peptidase
MQDNVNPEGLLHRFNCGNIDSLKQKGIREALLAFHKKWYSSNIMKLAVVSNKDMESLEKLVIELFSEVPNMSVEVPNLGEPAPFLQSDLG